MRISCDLCIKTSVIENNGGWDEAVYQNKHF